MNEQDRIRLLAEAMGWKPALGGDAEIIGGFAIAFKDTWVDPTGIYYTEKLPNPFTDANADYAVLEWIRTQGIIVSKIASQLDKPGCGKWSIDYQIGDYARAALKVIGDA